MMSATQKQDAVLVVSTGGQDLKVVSVIEKEGVQKLVLEPLFGREKHQELLDGTIKYQIEHDAKTIKTLLPSQYSGADPDFQYEVQKKDNAQPVTTDKGEWLLYPAKLASVAESVAHHFNIIGALVLYSKRRKMNDDEKNRVGEKNTRALQRDFNKEPIANGKLITEWLKKRFPGIQVETANYLENQIALEGATVLSGQFSAYDEPCALAVSAYIEKAVRDFRQHFPSALAVVSHTGGFGDIKSILTAATRLHFGGAVIELHDNKYANVGRGLDDPAQYRIPARNAVLDARHHAALRLWEGDFAGAWAVVSHIKKNDPGLPCDGWVSAIHDAASFMQGWAEPVELNPLAAVPKGRGLEKLFLLAWRVEAALQNNDGEPLIADVLRHLGTFREKLLEYLLLLGLEKMGGSIEIDEWKITKLPNGMNDKRIKIKTGYLDTRHPADLAMFFHNNRGSYQDLYKSYSPFHEMLERDIHKQCVDTTTRERDCLRAYRNRLTHNVLPADDIDKIREYGNRVRLWNTTPNGQKRDRLGACFLAMPAIEAIFDLIAPGCLPAREYRRFVDGLLDGILAPTRADCA
jgi:hypothetical protein